MATQPPLAGPLFTAVDATARAFYVDGAGALSAALVAPFKIFVTLYILLWGFAHFRGLVTEPIGDMVMRIFKICAIGIFVLKAPHYLNFVANWLYRSPQQIIDLLAPAVTGPLAGIGNPQNAVDAVLANSSNATERFARATAALPWRDVAARLNLTFCSILIELFSTIIFAIVIAVLLFTKVVMAVLLAIGPLFIGLLLFNPTRPMFSAWLGQVLGAAFTYVIAGVTMLLGLAAMQKHMDAALAASADGSVPAISQFSGFFFVSIAVVFVLLQVPSIGAAIGNGVQVSVLGAVGYVARATGFGASVGAGALIGAASRAGPASWATQRLQGLRANRVTRR